MALLPHCCIRKIGVAMSVFGRNFSSVKQGSYYLLELGKEPKGLELEDVDRPLERPQSRRRRGAHTLTSKRACQFRNSSGLKACGDRETRRGSVPGEGRAHPPGPGKGEGSRQLCKLSTKALVSFMVWLLGSGQPWRMVLTERNLSMFRKFALKA